MANFANISKHLTPKRILIFMVLGSIVFGVYIYFSIGVDQLLMVIDSIDISTFVFFYGLSFATMLVVMLLWSASWFTLLRALSVKMSLKKTFVYYIAGDFVDRIVPSPGVVGEATRAYLVRKNDASSSYGVIAAAGITNRIVNYGVVIGGLSAGILFLLITETVPVFASGLLLTVWLGAIALFAILSFVSLKDDAAQKLVAVLMKISKFIRSEKDAEKLSNRILRFLSRFHEGFKFFGANPYYLVAPIVFNILSFVLNLVVYMLVFYALGLSYLPLDFFIVVYFLAGAIQDGAAAFSVGGLEILLTNIFVLYGIPLAISGVAAVIVRIVTFYFPLIAGYVFLQLIGAKNVMNAETVKQVEAEE
ncbi:MAG: flippase-like domain-containing protein [Candidatus Bathyarchaeota archaeon]|nr:flippase-like domain-containing protein [Candidatus Bathyarchaeota archaeon]